MASNKSTVAVQADGRVKRPMTGWYDPGQIIRTTFSVAISTLFGRHADFRLLEALAASSEIHRFDNCDEAFWFDYTADVGDGWNSSYAIAYSLAQPSLSLCDASGAEYNTERGHLLVFGGDEVYPVASRLTYQEKFIDCYETALALTPPDKSPTMFAIPGNHDWYDGLAAFMRLFCSQRWIGGWRTQQQASYFAIKLPRGWWLIGTDIQLDSDIDREQVKYFRDVVKPAMKEGDRIILCVAEPHWIYTHLYGDHDGEYSESNLYFLERKVFEKEISVFVAGDLHHYRRHASPTGAQKITAGGGGAFLHPTHGPDVETLADDFSLQQAFPDQKTSRRLTWRNLAFPFWNGAFGIVTAILYLFTGVGGHADLSAYSYSEILPALAAAFEHLLGQPFGLFSAMMIFLAMFTFTDTHSKYFRFIASAVHGSLHLLMVLSLGWLVDKFTVVQLQLEFGAVCQRLLFAVMVFAGGWLIGSAIMGFYLLISLNMFNRHSNEAFSSLKIQDWKNFLRFKIDVDGSLTIFAVGLQRVPRKWKKVGEPGERSAIVPNDERATKPQLIDKVVLR